MFIYSYKKDIAIIYVLKNKLYDVVCTPNSVNYLYISVTSVAIT